MSGRNQTRANLRQLGIAVGQGGLPGSFAANPFRNPEVISVLNVTGVSPVASTGGTSPAISLQNSAAANVTTALGTDTAYFTASGSAAVNGDVITGDAQGGIKSSGVALSALARVRTVRSKTAAYVAVAGDVVLCNTTGGGFNVTMPAASSNGALDIIVKKVSVDGNAVTILPTGADTIDGLATYPITTPKTSIEMLSNGVDTWEVI